MTGTGQQVAQLHDRHDDDDDGDDDDDDIVHKLVLFIRIHWDARSTKYKIIC